MTSDPGGLDTPRSFLGWSWGGGDRVPHWAAHLIRMIEQVLDNQGDQMATEQELADGVHQLFGVVDSVLTKVGELAAGGGASPEQLQALLDEVNTERMKASDALAAVNPPPAPAGP